MSVKRGPGSGSIFFLKNAVLGLGLVSTLTVTSIEGSLVTWYKFMFLFAGLLSSLPTVCERYTYPEENVCRRLDD